MKYLCAMVCCLASGNACAGDTARHGFWGNVDVGFGNLHLATDQAGARTSTRFSLGLAGGYTLHPQLQLGLETTRWNIASGTWWDPTDGEGVATLFAVARLWPRADSRLFVKLGGGNVSHWDSASGASNGSGNGYTVGLGYQVMRYAGKETHLFLNYSSGSISDYTPGGQQERDEDYRAFGAGLSFGF